MKLSKEIKTKIKDILSRPEFIKTLYKGLTKERRDELGQFYTPADVCITMIEMYEIEDFSDCTVLDPCCGSGNLLIAMLIAGVPSKNLRGNEYDKTIIPTCRKRINDAIDILNEECFLGLQNRPYIDDWQIHNGNALHKFALTYFAPDYEECYFDSKTLPAARLRRLDNEKYDAYTMSGTFKDKYKDEHANQLNNCSPAELYNISVNNTTAETDWLMNT